MRLFLTSLIWSGGPLKETGLFLVKRLQVWEGFDMRQILWGWVYRWRGPQGREQQYLLIAENNPGQNTIQRWRPQVCHCKELELNKLPTGWMSWKTDSSLVKSPNEHKAQLTLWFQPCETTTREPRHTPRYLTYRNIT